MFINIFIFNMIQVFIYLNIKDFYFFYFRLKIVKKFMKIRQYNVLSLMGCLYVNYWFDRGLNIFFILQK